MDADSDTTRSGLTRDEALARIAEADRQRPPSRCGGIRYDHRPKETTVPTGDERLTLNDEADRFQRAAQAGAELAFKVYGFLADPAGQGTEVLQEAYDAFMAEHAANFTVREPV